MITKAQLDSALAGLFWIILLAVIPASGIALALIYKNPWFLWMIAPLMVFMEGGIFIIAVILTVTWNILGV